jgi:hypothetical protein
MEGAMPMSRCPNCYMANTSSLQLVSKFAPHDYFLCRACGHLWTVSRLTGAILNVTRLRRRSQNLDCLIDGAL